MNVIRQAEQTRRSLQETIDKLSAAVEKTLELIVRTKAADCGADSRARGDHSSEDGQDDRLIDAT